MNEWLNEGRKEWKNEGMKEWTKKMHLQTRMARASQQIDRHARNADNGDDSALLYSALLWRCLFLHFVMWNRALATTPCTFSTFHNFQKSVERLRLYIIVWNAKQALAIQSCVFVSPTTFLDGGPHLRKQRPSFGDHGSHFTRKNTRFRAKSAFHPWMLMCAILWQ